MMKYLLFVAALFFGFVGTSAQQKEQYYVKHLIFPEGATLDEKVDMASRLVPTPQQLAWQKMELTAFLHFGINTFTGREWGDGSEDPAIFKPTELDAGQWVCALKDAGFEMVILTAKHHDGFCLWPTKTTTHSVASSPWKKGKGDVVHELKKACDKYGLKFGVYLSPWDRNAEVYGDSPKYNQFFIEQLTELLTNYGDIHEVWFDGACGEGPNGKKQVYDWGAFYKTIQRLQPKAVMAVMGDDVRWVGNENGLGRETEWGVTALTPGIYSRSEKQNKALGLSSKAKDLGGRDIIGKAQELYWYPSEVDVSIRPGWFYHQREDDKVKSVSHLTDLYYRSVGHNATLLLNFPVDRRGKVHPIDSARAVAWHQRIKEELKTDFLLGLVPEATNVRGSRFSPTATTDGVYDTYWATEDGKHSGALIYSFAKPTELNRVLIQEYIPLGQRVKAFLIEMYADGVWTPVRVNEETTTVGYKRIVRFDNQTGEKLRVHFLDARGPLCINNVQAFCAPAVNDEVINPKNQSRQYAYKVLDMPEAQALKAYDGDASTTCILSGQSFVVDLGKEQPVASFAYLPDQGGDGAQGLIADYELYAGTSPDAITKKVAFGEFSNIKNNPIEQIITFTPVKARYFRLVAKRLVEGTERAGIANFALMGE